MTNMEAAFELHAYFASRPKEEFDKHKEAFEMALAALSVTAREPKKNPNRGTD